MLGDHPNLWPSIAALLCRHDPAGARQSLREGLALADRMQLPPRHYLRALLLAPARLENDHGQRAAAHRNAASALDAMGDQLPDAHRRRLQALALAGLLPKS